MDGVIDPAQRSSITLPDGRSLDVWQAGPPDGDPLVFHHGTPGAGLPFDHHVRLMADRGLRYIAWTRAGYGSSSRRRGRTVADDAKDGKAVLDHLGIDRAWVVGWSGGGPHALGFAAQLPDRVRGASISIRSAARCMSGREPMIGWSRMRTERGSPSTCRQPVHTSSPSTATSPSSSIPSGGSSTSSWQTAASTSAVAPAGRFTSAPWTGCGRDDLDRPRISESRG